MALCWTIDSPKRTVEIVADGDESMADAMAFFDATLVQAERIARLLGAAAVADHPMKVFDDVKLARRWLEARPPRLP
jgi:hypothetical protein